MLINPGRIWNDQNVVFVFLGFFNYGWFTTVLQNASTTDMFAYYYCLLFFLWEPNNSAESFGSHKKIDNN